MKKLNKCGLEPLKVATVSFHVVFVYISDDGNHWLEVQERRIAFISLGDQIIAPAQLGIGTRAIQPAAYDKCWVKPSFGQHASSQTGGGGFAMSARDGDTIAKTHQFGQHLGAGYYRYLVQSRELQFRIVTFDRAGNHDYFSHARVFSAVP